MTIKKTFINYYSAQRIHWFRLNSCKKQKERTIQSPFSSHKISMLDAQIHSEPLLSELLGKKHDILTCESNMLSSCAKGSSLLWLHDKLHFLQWKLTGMVFHCVDTIIKKNITWPLRDMKFLLLYWKIFHSFTVLALEIFFQYPKRTFLSVPCDVISSTSTHQNIDQWIL